VHEDVYFDVPIALEIIWKAAVGAGASENLASLGKRYEMAAGCRPSLVGSVTNREPDAPQMHPKGRFRPPRPSHCVKRKYADLQVLSVDGRSWTRTRDLFLIREG